MAHLAYLVIHAMDYASQLLDTGSNTYRSFNSILNNQVTSHFAEIAVFMERVGCRSSNCILQLWNRSLSGDKKAISWCWNRVSSKSIRRVQRPRLKAGLLRGIF